MLRGQFLIKDSYLLAVELDLLASLACGRDSQTLSSLFFVEG